MPEVGALLTTMVNYINSVQTANSYSPLFGASQNTMSTALYEGIKTYQAPPMLGIKTEITKGWYYDSDGHNVLVNAARDDKAEFQLADPIMGYLNLGNAYYKKSVSTIYQAYSAENLGLMW